MRQEYRTVRQKYRPPLSFLVIEFLGGTKGVRDQFAVEAAATDTGISYFRSFLFSGQDPYRFPDPQIHGDLMRPGISICLTWQHVYGIGIGTRVHALALRPNISKIVSENYTLCLLLARAAVHASHIIRLPLIPSNNCSHW